MAPSATATDRVSFTTFSNVVNGELRTSKTTTQGINPVTSEKLWDVPVATEADLDEAVKAARKAFPSWAKTPIEERKRLVLQWNDVFKSYTAEFTELLIKECGKPRMFAQGEVAATSDFITHHTTLDLPTEELDIEKEVIKTRYVPLGIVGAICPWNFPLVLSSGKISPALVTGNCIIVKPSPFTPYTALKLCEIAKDIFPPGVFQVLGGDDKLGPWMTSHHDIQKISFTGSIATGKRIMAACASTLKRVTLELGGNDASIVCPDVDIASTAPMLAMGAFFNSGQVCVATKRIYIHQDIYEPMVKAMADFAKTLKVGGDEEGVMVGPIQNSMQHDRVQGFFDEGKKEGWKYAAGGEVKRGDKGYFIQPTIVDNPPSQSRIIQEEPFGPIVPTQPWTDEAEVISRANDTNTGLGACVWSKDISRAERIAEQLEAGSVWINSFEQPTPKAAFGGFKESGIGAEWGSKGLLSFCNVQAVHIYKGACM
ncbi:aldehyde dehydrogenase [Phlyctema vagabunda]|uniref:aldehyde dehydrogenase (NAD(+)) n=1 Tax=Phlyctema vagabunda TaxID=108571 RepID=A0ABR4PSL1_9HELO